MVSCLPKLEYLPSTYPDDLAIVAESLTLLWQVFGPELPRLPKYYIREQFQSYQVRTCVSLRYL